MVALTPPRITWRGMVLHGQLGPTVVFHTQEVEGWEGTPSVSSDMAQRPAQHGTFGAAPLGGARIVTGVGFCSDSADPDARVVELESYMTLSQPGAVPEPLTILSAGRELTAWGWLINYEPILDGSDGAWGWKAQWKCPSFLRYGARVPSTTSFPERTGGLRFPLFTDGLTAAVGFAGFGPQSTQGDISLTNVGAYPTPVQYEVAGPVGALGFTITTSATGARLVYEGAVPDARTLVLDGATGSCLMDGVDDCSDKLTVNQFEQVQPNATTIQRFTPIGSRTDAVLTASLAPAF